MGVPEFVPEFDLMGVPEFALMGVPEFDLRFDGCSGVRNLMGVPEFDFRSSRIPEFAEFVPEFAGVR